MLQKNAVRGVRVIYISTALTQALYVRVLCESYFLLFFSPQCGDPSTKLGFSALVSLSSSEFTVIYALYV